MEALDHKRRLRWACKPILFLSARTAIGPTSTGNGFIAPNYKTPMSIQMNLGIQREIRSGLVLTADSVRNVGLHYGDARYQPRW